MRYMDYMDLISNIPSVHHSKYNKKKNQITQFMVISSLLSLS